MAPGQLCCYVCPPGGGDGVLHCIRTGCIALLRHHQEAAGRAFALLFLVTSIVTIFAIFHVVGISPWDWLAVRGFLFSQDCWLMHRTAPQLCTGGDLFPSLQPLSGLPEMRIMFWFNAYSTRKGFYFPATFVKMISGMKEDFCFYFPNVCYHQPFSFFILYNAILLSSNHLFHAAK